MRAPSVDLLRALRSAAHTSSKHQVHHTKLRPSHTHYVSRIPLRYATTSARPVVGRSPSIASRSAAPRTHDRGPTSKEDTQTDFGKMDILGNMTTPATSIDACIADGFHLNNGIQTRGGSGILLFGGEAFTWRPWAALPGAKPDARIDDMLSRIGVLNLPNQSWTILDLLYPKPDLLIIGTGSKLWMLSKEARAYLGQLGVKVDAMDTPNAAAAYNLLATERGVEEVAAAFLPIGFKGI